MIAAAALVTAARPDAAGKPGPPPSGLAVHLDDEDDGTSWRTFWALCWDPYPGAVAYDVMTVTGEGASPRIHRQPDRCVRVEAAAGEGRGDARAARRAAQLATQQGQLAYRVRAVPDEGPPGQWSPAVAVGTETVGR